jgi:hypothetical protein
MADRNPTSGRRAVPLDLPAAQITILRDDLGDWLAGVRADLEVPEKLRNPDRSHREAEVYERLLQALDRGEILVPDEEARMAIEAAAKAHDEEFNFAEISAAHDAHHGLLTLLGGARS